jgi:hypothetical protein
MPNGPSAATARPTIKPLAVPRLPRVRNHGDRHPQAGEHAEDGGYLCQAAAPAGPTYSLLPAPGATRTAPSGEAFWLLKLLAITFFFLVYPRKRGGFMPVGLPRSPRVVHYPGGPHLYLGAIYFLS